MNPDISAHIGPDSVTDKTGSALPARSGDRRTRPRIGPTRSARPSTGASLAARITDWLQRRTPPSDTVRLTQRNVYILPSRGGLLYAATLAVLLVASINYQLNLGHLLTFLLAGSGLVAMHLTHGTLRGLDLQLRPVAPTHAGDAAALAVVVAAPQRQRWGIGLRLTGAPVDATVAVDVPAGGTAAAALSFTPARRGWQAVPSIRLDTRFPLGLFTAWAVWRPAARLLVYPRVEAGAPRLPAAQAVSRLQQQGRPSPGGDTEGVRIYRHGDPLKAIVWKKAAQSMAAGGDLISRDSVAPADRELWLAWSDCAPLAHEERLSRLTAWVVAAHVRAVRYGLDLPGVRLPADTGELHRRRCLEALAVWQ